jgi:hypothetical protein
MASMATKNARVQIGEERTGLSKTECLVVIHEQPSRSANAWTTSVGLIASGSLIECYGMSDR